ncbi:hypothetical protein GH808_09145 [Acetobacterium fimetarium]|uniref:Uncharacterized protein n=1 Tax=Acetobacterium fimetarium TaxID=52691 RepID=A0ABR6WW62_9FIRM|nr:hypothetical protein [Acetobacterium fimetarium]MBC3804595.1 hypothetical protein [Acetobacterium fimetarium]
MYQLINISNRLDEACIRFCALPNEVQIFITDVLSTLDESYGSKRDPIRDLGGYVIGIENPADFQRIIQMTAINLDTAICELVDLIKGYYCCLVLLGSDYALYFIIPESITPKNIQNQMEI